MQIAEIFHSIQGEGALTGVPSVFIRTSGCNLRCAWCDTMYASWNPEQRELALEAVLAAVDRFPAAHAVITGGEPMTAEGIHALAAALKLRGLHVTVETNGTVAPDGIAVDLASVSPKLRNSEPDAAQFPREARLQAEGRRWNVEALRPWIDSYDYQLKFVVRGEEDLGEIRALIARIGREVPAHRILLMPEGKDPETLRRRDAEIVDLCKRHGYRYCRRVHIDLFGNVRGT